MNRQTEEFIRSRVELMQVLGLTDNQTGTDEYINMMKLMLEEQNEKIKISDSKLIYDDEIIEIEEFSDMETVDISVTGDQLFYCNGILTKNSIGLAATADVIISIFQNEEDQDMNIIRLGMMKNRYGPRGMVQLMKINYDTLTIDQSDEECSISSDDNVSLLEKFAD